MIGVRGLLERSLFSLINRRQQTDPAPKPTGTTVPEGHFCFGTALEFGNAAPPAGSIVSAPIEIFGRQCSIDGSSGSGKSVFNRNLRRALIKAGIAVADIDFRSDAMYLALEDLVQLGHPASRLTVIDWREAGETPTAYNLLGYGPGSAHARAAATYTALRHGALSWGVQLGPDLNGCLISLAHVRGSLLDVAAVLDPARQDFRDRLMEAIGDEYALEFLKAYSALSPDAQRTRASACVNKLDEYVSYSPLRKALSLPGFPDVEEMMKPGHVTLVALGAHINPQAVLAGRMLVAALQKAAMMRADLPPEQRPPFRLIVDEAHNLLGPDAREIFSEGRRFSFGLACSTQFTNGMDPSLRDTMRVNCNVQVHFQNSAAEAAEIAPDVSSSLSREEVRKVVTSAKVGTAIVAIRGRPSALVEIEREQRPQTDPGAVIALKLAATARTRIDRGAAEPALSSKTIKNKEREVRHVRKPFTKG